MNDTLLLNADGQPMSYVPLSTRPAVKALRLFYLGKVIVLKDYDDWVLRSATMEIKVPSIIMMTKHVKWSKEIKYSRGNIFLRDDFTCQLQYTNRCKELHGKVKFNELTLDHVVPASLGGKTTWKNICTSCKDCNSAKGNNASILPKKQPHRPTYYEILGKRKRMPLQIPDPEWKFYLDWPDELIHVTPRANRALKEDDTGVE